MQYKFKINKNMEQIDKIDEEILKILQKNADVNNVMLAEMVHISPPTCLRRVKRLKEAGWIEQQISILSLEKMNTWKGAGLTAIVEVTLDKQGAEHWDAFESRVIQDESVQQCWRVSPGPDFVLVIQTRDMPGYLETTQKLLTQDANVRNVKAFFSIKRAKFTMAYPI